MAGVKGRSGGDRPGSGRPKIPVQKIDGSKAPKVAPARRKAKKPIESAEDKLAKKAEELFERAFVLPEAADCEKLEPGQPRKYTDPRQLIIDIMNADIDVKVRLEAAKVLMPFDHAKKADIGKKEEKNLKAAEVSKGKFAPSAPPKLAVDNTKR